MIDAFSICLMAFLVVRILFRAVRTDRLRAEAKKSFIVKS